MAESEDESITGMSSRKGSMSISEGDIVNTEQSIFDENAVEDTAGDEQQLSRPEKRKEREEGAMWTEVKSKGKKQKPQADRIEVYISCREQPLPKTFALAKFLKESNVTDIEKVKYINPFKVRLDMKNEVSAERIVKCKAINDKGWLIQKALEKNLSYGVIRDVDLDMTEQDIHNRITCPGSIKLMSVFRLNRRSTIQAGWCPSESVRLCFKGDILPAYVDVDNLRMRVSPYVFPVSQCSVCWRLGHTAKRCTFNKVVCPKCGGNHENCETRSFKCVNCRGSHMSMYKGCPVFLKEKKLREIMADFNVSYKKSLMMYVTPTPQRYSETAFNMNTINTPASGVSFQFQNSSVTPQRDIITYSEAIRTEAVIHNQKSPNIKKSYSKVPRNLRGQQREDSSFFGDGVTPNPDQQENSEPIIHTEEKKETSFSELLVRLKEIVFMKGLTFQCKVKSVLKCSMEWLISIVVSNLSDWPILKNCLEFCMTYG